MAKANPIQLRPSLYTLRITVQKARDGQDYVQIMSSDQTSVNIVLVAPKIEVKDQR